MLQFQQLADSIGHAARPRVENRFHFGGILVLAAPAGG
jgi:hypothetical protein